MKNIEQILKDAGIEVTEEQLSTVNGAVAENYRSIVDYNKQVKKTEAAEDSNKSLQSQIDDLQEAVKKFDGEDVEGLKKAAEEANKRAEEAEKAAEAKLYERDYADALKAELSAYKFTSEAAGRDVMAQVKAAGLKLSDGKLLGLSDLMGQIKKADSTAFVDEEAEAAKQAEEEARKKAAESAPKFTEKAEPKPNANEERKKVPVIF
jgi:hypothetical protein